MRNLCNRKTGVRSVRSTIKSVVVIGATSALMVTGLAFVAVSPASAAGLPSKVVYNTLPPTTTVAGTALASFSVNVEDSSSTLINTGTGSTDTVSITSSCTLTGTPSVAAVAGVATFSAVTITTGTSCTLVASDTTTSSVTTATSAPIAVTPTAAAKIAYTTVPPTTGTLNIALTTFKVSVEDQYGNVITTGTGSTDAVAIASSCGLTGGGATAVSGVATFSSFTITSGTSCALTATAGAFPTITSAAVNIATNAPAEVGFTTQPAATVVAGTALPSFAVSVEESNSIPITSGTGATDVVTLTSACTLSGTTSATAAAGVATFNAVTIKTGSSCQLVATDTTRTLATATSTAINVLAGAPTQVAFTVAPPATETVASTILATFKAGVEDVNGNVATTGTGSTDTIVITSNCTLGGTTSAVAVGGVATFSALSINATGACVLTATDTTRTLVAAAHTTSVGTPQATVTVRTLKGSVGTVLRLSISGGTGTGAVTWTLAAGSSAGCSLSGNSLTARRAGTCSVTATKAGDTTYIAASSPATTVSFVVPFKAIRVIGAVFAGRTATATITGSGFYGRPRVISNVGGITARVIRDTGRTLTVVISAGSGVRRGIHAFTIILANGKRTSVRYSLR